MLLRNSRKQKPCLFCSQVTPRCLAPRGLNTSLLDKQESCFSATRAAASSEAVCLRHKWLPFKVRLSLSVVPACISRAVRPTPPSAPSVAAGLSPGRGASLKRQAHGCCPCLSPWAEFRGQCSGPELRSCSTRSGRGCEALSSHCQPEVPVRE